MIFHTKGVKIRNHSKLPHVTVLLPNFHCQFQTKQHIVILTEDLELAESVVWENVQDLEYRSTMNGDIQC